MTYFVLILSVINILLFFIFLLKFKSIFSTDSILEKTTKRVDKIIAELNENAQRDIDLVGSSSRKLQKQLERIKHIFLFFRVANNYIIKVSFYINYFQLINEEEITELEKHHFVNSKGSKSPKDLLV